VQSLVYLTDILTIQLKEKSFYRYDLVKFLKTEIETCIGPVVDEEIERYSENSHHDNMSDTDTLVTNVTQKILKSTQ